MSTPILTGLKVLVVEDETFLASVIQRQLGRAGCTAIAVASPRDALAMVERGDLVPDVVLTDMELPEMSGDQLIATLRERHPAIRAVLMSGNAPATEARPGGATPATPFLLKPFDIAQLTRMLAVVSGREPDSR